MDDKEGAIEKEDFDVVSGLPVEGIDEISKLASPFVIKTEPNDDEIITEGVDEISQTIAVIKAESKDNELPEVYGPMISQQPDQIVVKAESKDNELPEVYGPMISQQPDQIVVKAESKDNELPEVYGPMISQQLDQIVVKAESKDNELPEVYGPMISQQPDQIVVKAESKDNELPEVYGPMISQQPDQIVVKAESKDNELPEVYGPMISQQLDQIVVKAELLNDELPAVCKNVICQTTLPSSKKTETKDEEQHFGLLENLVHRNSLHYETPDSQPQVVIETKPLDELYGHEFSAEQSCEVQSGECDVQTVPKRKKKSAVHKRRAESKGQLQQGIKLQNVSSHIGLKKQQCYICNRTFKFIQNLKIHMKSHDLKSHVASNKKTCEICCKTYAPSSFAGHMKKHKLLPFRCKRCARLFPSNDVFESHRKDCERKKPMVCQICQLGFSLERSLKEHYCVFHKSVNENVYSCLFCSKRFRGKKNLLRHTKNHTQPDKINIKCPVCTDTFIGMDCFNDHFKTHDTAKDFVWCDFCKEHFLLSNYETHLQNRHKCQVCSKSFKRVELLRNHQAHCNNVEETFIEEIYKCYICLKSFRTKEILNAHKSKHQVLGMKVFQCWICNKEVSAHATLHIHFYTHKENLPMKCNVCCKKISWTDESNYIIKGEKFECGVCKKKFTGHSTLHRHFYTHKENLPMNCNECSKKISWTDESNYNIKREKLVCGVCKKKCADHRTLHRHFYTHKENLPMKCNVCFKKISWTDESNYIIKREKLVCGVCKKKFPFHSTLHRHFYTHKENLPMKCNVCSLLINGKNKRNLNKEQAEKKWV